MINNLLISKISSLFTPQFKNQSSTVQKSIAHYGCVYIILHSLTHLEFRSKYVFSCIVTTDKSTKMKKKSQSRLMFPLQQLLSWYSFSEFHRNKPVEKLIQFVNKRIYHIHTAPHFSLQKRSDYFNIFVSFFFLFESESFDKFIILLNWSHEVSFQFIIFARHDVDVNDDIKTREKTNEKKNRNLILRNNMEFCYSWNI